MLLKGSLFRTTCTSRHAVCCHCDCRLKATRRATKPESQNLAVPPSTLPSATQITPNTISTARLVLFPQCAMLEFFWRAGTRTKDNRFFSPHRACADAYEPRRHLRSSWRRLASDKMLKLVNGRFLITDNTFH